MGQVKRAGGCPRDAPALSQSKIAGDGGEHFAWTDALPYLSLKQKANEMRAAIRPPSIAVTSSRAVNVLRIGTLSRRRDKNLESGK
jgi:hypothetical protein